MVQQNVVQYTLIVPHTLVYSCKLVTSLCIIIQTNWIVFYHFKVSRLNSYFFELSQCVFRLVRHKFFIHDVPVNVCSQFLTRPPI